MKANEKQVKEFMTKVSSSVANVRIFSQKVSEHLKRNNPIYWIIGEFRTKAYNPAWYLFNNMGHMTIDQLKTYRKACKIMADAYVNPKTGKWDAWNRMMNGAEELIKKLETPAIPELPANKPPELHKMFTARWGTCGPYGNQPLQYKRLIDFSTSHLINILTMETQASLETRKIINSILRQRKVV